MRVAADPDEWRVVIRLDHDAEEASLVYDLVHSGRLLLETPDILPLPFRGQFLFKLPERPRPIAITVGRFEPTASDVLAGEGSVKLLVACPRGVPGLLPELETALREVPPVSEEEFKSDGLSGADEFVKVRNMTFAQRVIYATRAGLSGRTVLMQQPSPLLLLYLCKNPLIQLPEIIHIAKLPSIDALVAEYIAKMLRANPEWAMSDELKLALAANMKTPIGTALAMLTHLSTRSLRALNKRGELRGTLKQAAMKLLNERRD
jgi:hypothetical protein